MVSEAVPPGLEAGVGAAVPPARGALLAIALLLVVLVGEAIRLGFLIL